MGLQLSDLSKNETRAEELIFFEHKGLLIPTLDEVPAFHPNPCSDSATKNNSLQLSTQEKFGNEVEVLSNQVLPSKYDTTSNSLSLQEASVEKRGQKLGVAVNESKLSIYVENPSTSRENSISSPQFLQDKGIDNSRPKPGTVANITQIWHANNSNSNKMTKTELCAESQNQSSSPKNALSELTAQINDISRTTLSLNPVPKSSLETENSAASNLHEGDSLFINTPGRNPQESNSSRTNAKPNQTTSDEKLDQPNFHQLQGTTSTESAFQCNMAEHVSAKSLQKVESLLISMDKQSSPSIGNKTLPKNQTKILLNPMNEDNNLFSDAGISMFSQPPAKEFEDAVSLSKPRVTSSTDNGGGVKIIANGATAPFEAILPSNVDGDFVVTDSEASHFSPQTYLTSKLTRIRDFPRFTTPFSALQLSAAMAERKRAQWNISSKTSLNPMNEDNDLFSDADISMFSQPPAKEFEDAVSLSKPPVTSSTDNGGAVTIVANKATAPFEAILSSNVDGDFVVSDSEASHFSPHADLTSKLTRIRDFPSFPTPFSALSAAMTERKRARWNINN